MALTDTQIRAAQPQAKAYKLADESGLYVHCMPSGARIFRVRWQKDGRETVETLGHYGDLTLGKARRRAKGARRGWLSTSVRLNRRSALSLMNG